MKILIVDDAESIRTILTYFLEQEGYKDLILAESVNEAFAILETEVIDLILMDIIMPDRDGIQACRCIKKKDNLKDIPIIMVTGKTDNDYLKRAFDAGAIDYITKPINRVELLARVNSAVKLIKNEKELERTVSLLEQANQELEKMVLIDGLTEIANRKFFDQTLAQEWLRAKRKAHNLGLLMIDIDRFKEYNDTYGHQAGDKCLQRLAKRFEELIFRPGDLVVRYGGEEFSVILPEVDLAAIEKVAERIRKGVVELEIEHQKSDISKYVTLSLGAAIAQPSYESGQAKLIEAADKALYQAKRSGRNQIIIYEQIIK